MLLRSEHLASIIAHARETAPAECCGLIGGVENDKANTIYRLRNVTPQPELSYEAAPEELFAAQRQMRSRGEEFLAQLIPAHPKPTSDWLIIRLQPT